MLYFGSRQNQTFTQFVRLLHQGEALAGPVVDFLRPGGRRDPLRIVVFGCTTGAEPYSMASTLARCRPDLPFRVLATDIDKAMIEKALSARYSRDEVKKNAFVDEEFVASTFLREGASFLGAAGNPRANDLLDWRRTSTPAPAHMIRGAEVAR